MPPDPVTAVASFGGVLVAITLWTWKGVRNVRGNFGDEYDKMRNHLKSRFRHELNQVVLQILDEVEFDELDQGEQPVEVLTMDAIETQIERDELGDVEQNLREFDRPSELLEEVKDTYDSVWREFGKAALGSFILAGALLLLSGDSLVAVGAFTGLVTLLSLASGISAMNQARKSERALEDMMDNYREEY